MTAAFELLARSIVAANNERLLDYCADEQIARAVEALEQFAKTTPLTPVNGLIIDLAGFGEAEVHFESTDDRYLLLSEVAEALGMPVWEACDWARQEYLYTVEGQREMDEERGDGKLGYECMRSFLDLRFSFIQDNPEAKPDAQGKRWSSFGDWLIAHDRLMSLILSSPWSREFMNNTADAMAHGMQKFFGEQLKDLPAYHADGTPATGVELFRSDLTEEEALRKARRGPAGALDSDTP